MTIDLMALKTCNTVVLLPGWEKSKGARIEVTRASDLGITIYSPKGAADWILEELERRRIQAEGLRRGISVKYTITDPERGEQA